MNICMFVKNSFEYDARVEREARTLVAAGHRVTVVALLVPGVTPPRETTAGGFDVVRVPSPRFGLGRIVAWLTRSGGDGAVSPSTAAPGRDRAVPAPTDTSSTRRARRAVARVLARVVRIARTVLRGPLGLVKTRILDRRMRDIGLGTEAEVFHAHDLNTLSVAVRCARSGGRVVYDSHELAAERSRMRWVQRRWARFREGRLLRRVDAFIVASPPWDGIVRSRNRSVPELAAAVLNAPELYDPEPVDLHALAGLDPGTPILLYQGSIQEHRGIEPAIEAMQDLDDMALVVIGYGHHRPALEAMVRRLDLTDRVRFTGPVPHDELLDHTAGASIGLCNIVSSSLSYHTSLPNKLFEYLMAGVPVIGPEGPEMARVVRETGAGLVVDSTDPVAIAAAARAILRDREQYVAAAQRARLELNWEAEAEKLVALYERLAA